VSARICVAVGVLVLLVNIVCGGEYQRALDGKTLVWNNDPKPDDGASWSGKQDKDGYATGRGTLVWYRLERAKVTGSHMPADKRVPISSYTGKMVHGKLNGAVVAADPSGKFYHGTFANGRRTGDWSAGVPRVQRAEPFEPAAPAEGPARATAENAEAPAPASQPEAEQPKIETTTKTAPSAPPGAAAPTTQVSDSLRSLIAPPASLRTEAATEQTAPAIASPPVTKTSAAAAEESVGLNAAEAIELADAEARARGYKLDEYQHPQVQYVTDSETWSVSYEPNTSSATAFDVIVDEKTKKAQIKK
jgi:hypothetical protein